MLVWDGENLPRILPVRLDPGDFRLPISDLPASVIERGYGLVAMPLSGLEKTVFTRLGIAAELGEY